MKYELTPAQLVPEVVIELTELPAQEHKDEGQLLRHPSDTFVVAFRELLESGVQLCQDHKQALATPEDSEEANDVDTRLRLSLRLFHSRVSEYLEACKKIIYSVKPEKEAGKVNRSLHDATKPFYDQAKMIDNFIKHQQRAVRTVYAQWSEGKIIGYQIEGAIGTGAVGAEPKIHRYPGTAFSVNRALKEYACRIYLVANALKSVLNLPKPAEQKRLSELEKLAAKFLDLVANIPLFFFPDEQQLPVPLVKKRADGTYLLEYPSITLPANRKPHPMNMKFRFTPSAHTVTVEVPYSGTARPWEKPQKK